MNGHNSNDFITKNITETINNKQNSNKTLTIILSDKYMTKVVVCVSTIKYCFF